MSIITNEESAGGDVRRGMVMKSQSSRTAQLKVFDSLTSRMGSEAKERLRAELIAEGYEIKKPDHCFIATACFDNANASEVRVLKHWRDEVLERHAAGRAFVRIYYAIAPGVASWLRKHSAACAFVRRALVSLVCILERMEVASSRKSQ